MVLFSKKGIGGIKMEILGNKVSMIFDKETLRVYCRTGWSGQCNDRPDIEIRHEDRPAEVMTEVLKTLSVIYPSIQNRVDIVIGSPWAHSVVLPWADYAWSLRTWKSYAQAQFAARMPDMQLKIRILDEEHGYSRIGVGIHYGFQIAIRRAVAEAGWKISGMRDLLSFSLSANADAIQDEDFCFLLAEKEVVTCLFRHRREWRNAVSFPRIDNTIVEWIKVGALISGQPEPEKVYAIGTDFLGCTKKFVTRQVPDRPLGLPLQHSYCTA